MEILQTCRSVLTPTGFTTDRPQLQPAHTPQSPTVALSHIHPHTPFCPLPRPMPSPRPAPHTHPPTLFAPSRHLPVSTLPHLTPHRPVAPPHPNPMYPPTSTLYCASLLPRGRPTSLPPFILHTRPTVPHPSPVSPLFFLSLFAPLCSAETVWMTAKKKKIGFLTIPASQPSTEGAFMS